MVKINKNFKKFNLVTNKEEVKFPIFKSAQFHNFWALMILCNLLRRRGAFNSALIKRSITTTGTGDISKPQVKS